MNNSNFKYSISSSIDSGGVIDYEEPVLIFFNNVFLGKPDSINILVYTIEGEPQIRMITYDGEKIKYTLDASKTSMELIITYVGNRVTKERDEPQTLYNLYQDDKFLTTMLSYRK